jgi:predicted amidohydrolase
LAEAAAIIGAVVDDKECPVVCLASSANRGEGGRVAEYRKTHLTRYNWRYAYSLPSTFSRVAAMKSR